jgi:hypothetical protein
LPFTPKDILVITGAPDDADELAAGGAGAIEGAASEAAPTINRWRRDSSKPPRICMPLSLVAWELAREGARPTAGMPSQGFEFGWKRNVSYDC